MGTGIPVGHIRVESFNPLLQSRNLLRIFLVDTVLQIILLTQVIGFQKPQPLDSDIQVHFLLDVGIACTQGLDLRIAQCCLVDILGGADGTLGGHDLTDKLLLGFHQLIQVAVKGVLGDIGVDIHLRVFVALSDNTSLPLL